MYHHLPHRPGIYQFFNESGQLLYVGKAKDLFKRVSSYFKDPHKLSVKTQKMMSKVKSLQYVETDSEVEALILETNLIKEHAPRYNILMRDDKNHLFIKVTTGEDFPRILTDHQLTKLKQNEVSGIYFGPKTATDAAMQALEIARKFYPYRNCNLNITLENGTVRVKNPYLNIPCLEYHLGRCPGPCVAATVKTTYDQNIKQMLEFLRGHYEPLLEKIKTAMTAAATARQYEVAATLRDQMQAVTQMSEKQKISSPNDPADRDVVAFVLWHDTAYFHLFQIREGKLINALNYKLVFQEDEPPDRASLLANFLTQYYSQTINLPAEILLPESVTEMALLETWLTSLRGAKVSIIIPQIGTKNKLLVLAERNALNYCETERPRFDTHQTTAARETFQNTLGCTTKRLECYDISHLSGTATVAAMVVFCEGRPARDQYRHFHIKTLPSGEVDDFQSLREVLERRLKYLTHKITVVKPAKKEGVDLEKRFSPPPLTTAKRWWVKDNDQYVGYVDIENTPIPYLYNFDLPPEWSYWSQLWPTLLRRAAVDKLYIPELVEPTTLWQWGFTLVKNAPTVPWAGPVWRANTKQLTIDASFAATPDLLIIDGGAGQLSAVSDVLQSLQLHIPVIGLAKKREEIYVPGQTPFTFPEGSPARHLLQQIRDEAHRFAITFNRETRQKKSTASALDTWPGVGPAIRRKLIQHFGSLATLQQVSETELQAVLGPHLGQRLYSLLHSTGHPQ